MSKVWFIFENDRHVGPFTYEDISIRFRSGKINGDTLVWREGEPTWNPMKSVSAFHQLLGIEEKLPEPEVEVEVEPEPEIVFDTEIILEEVEVVEEVKEEEFLPEIPQDEPAIEEIEGDEPPSLPPIPQEEDEIVDELPPIPVDEPVQTEVEEVADEASPEQESQDEIVDEEPPEEIVQLVDKLEQGRRKKIIKIAMGVASLVVVVLWLSFFMLSGSVEVPGKGLSPSDYQRLLKVTQLSSAKPHFELALATNHKHFVLASNFDHSATIYLTLNSLNGKVLAREKVQISSIAQMSNKVAVFKDLRLEDSDKIERGLYMMKVRGLDTSLRIKFLKFLRDLEIFNFIKYVREVDDRFLFRSEFVLGFTNHYAFQSALKKYKQEEKERQVQPVQEVLQRYRTYHAMLKRLNELFSHTLIGFKKRGAIKRFENVYAQEIAPLYQTLTVESQKIQVSLIESDSELSTEYQKLVSYGKQIGILVSEMTERLNQYRKLKKKTRLQLLREFQGKLNELEELGKMRIHKIEEKLSSL